MGAGVPPREQFIRREQRPQVQIRVPAEIPAQFQQVAVQAFQHEGQAMVEGIQSLGIPGEVLLHERLEGGRAAVLGGPQGRCLGHAPLEPGLIRGRKPRTQVARQLLLDRRQGTRWPGGWNGRQ
jgi:hypothetical protein